MCVCKCVCMCMCICKCKCIYVHLCSAHEYNSVHIYIWRERWLTLCVTPLSRLCKPKPVWERPELAATMQLHRQHHHHCHHHTRHPLLPSSSCQSLIYHPHKTSRKGRQSRQIEILGDRALEILELARIFESPPPSDLATFFATFFPVFFMRKILILKKWSSNSLQIAAAFAEV